MAVLFAVSFFLLFLFSTILIYQSAVRYFISNEVYYRIRIRVPPGGYIIYQSHLLMLRYPHELFLHFVNRDDGSFTPSVICCRSEDNFP